MWFHAKENVWYHDEVIAESFVLDKLNSLRWRSWPSSWNLFLLTRSWTEESRLSAMTSKCILLENLKSNTLNRQFVKTFYTRVWKVITCRTADLIYTFTGKWIQDLHRENLVRGRCNQKELCDKRTENDTCKLSGSTTAVEPLALTETPHAGIEASFSCIPVSLIATGTQHWKDELRTEEEIEHSKLRKGAKLRRAHSKPGEQRPSRRCRKQDVAAGAAAVIDVLIVTLWRTQRKHHYKGQKESENRRKNTIRVLGAKP